MKTIAKNNRFRFAFRKAMLTVAAAVVVGASQMAFANGPKPSSTSSLQTAVFQVKGTLKFKAVVANPEKVKFTVVIRDKDNSVVYSESGKGGYIRTFNLADMEDGTYTFEIKDGQSVQRKSFTIETATARMVNIED